MQIIKFLTSNPLGYTKTMDFTAGVPGYWLTLNDNDYKLSDGDYILIDDSGKVFQYFTSDIYGSDITTQQIIKEYVSKQCLRTIWQTLAQSGLTDSVRASILNTILATIVALVAGEIKAAQIIANATATDTNFTQARKNILLNLLNNSIALL